MNRKQQLASAAAESDPLRKDNQQLRNSLARLQEDNSNLTQRLRDEAAARRAAVEAKVEVENRLMEMQSLKENAEVRGALVLLCCEGAGGGRLTGGAQCWRQEVVG